MTFCAFFCVFAAVEVGAVPAVKAEKKTFDIKIDAGKKVYKLNSVIPVRIKMTFPDTHWCCQHGLYAFVQDLPSNFVSVVKPKLIPNKKNPRLSRIQFHTQWISLPAQRKLKERVLKLSTKNWPAGDYCISTNFYLMPVRKNSGVRDCFVQGKFYFTLEK